MTEAFIGLPFWRSGGLGPTHSSSPGPRSSALDAEDALGLRGRRHLAAELARDLPYAPDEVGIGRRPELRIGVVAEPDRDVAAHGDDRGGEGETIHRDGGPH